MFYAGLMVVLLGAVQAPEIDNESGTQQAAEMIDSIKQQLNPSQSPLSPTEAAAAAELSRQVSTLDWLGPLAPIALSPFFGITCLSGLAIWGPEWLPGRNTLLQSSVLKNPAVFWSFLALTVMTSLPRLTKVSKPFVQAMDRLEAYAAIITLIVIKFLATGESSPIEPGSVATAGLAELPADVFLCFAAGLNILVINGVKFFFEMLVWLTPIPMIDAMFEAANKSACALLMTLYAFSPLLATALNLAIFLVCLLIFRWVYRRITFYRTLIIEPIWANIFGRSDPPEYLTIFPKTTWRSFRAKQKLLLVPGNEGQLQIVQWRWPFAARTLVANQSEAHWSIRQGLCSCEITYRESESESVVFVTSWQSLAEVEKCAAFWRMRHLQRGDAPASTTTRVEWA